MPNYDPNYIYSPKYGTRYMGQKIPAPAQGGAGSQDLASAPVNYEAGVNPSASATNSAGVVPTGEAANGNISQNMNGPVGWTDSTGRDTSAISNLGDFGFRPLTNEDDPLSDFDTIITTPPVTGGGIPTTGTTLSPTTPTIPPVVAPTTPTAPTTVTSPSIPRVTTTTSDSTIIPSSPKVWYGDTPEDAVNFVSSTVGPSDVYPGIMADNGRLYTVVDPVDERYSGFMVDPYDKWATGNFNIAGDGMMAGEDGVWLGNPYGYEGNKAVQLGLALKDYPAWLPGGLLAKGLSDALIGYKSMDIPEVGEVIGTRGSFEPGAFSSESDDPLDISGGASGSNVGTNQYGNKISLGYGYGQVDPNIARAAGYTVGEKYSRNPRGFDTAIADVDTTGMSADEIQTAMANSGLYDNNYLTAEGRIDAQKLQDTYAAQDSLEYNQAVEVLDNYGISAGDKDRRTLQAELPQAKEAYDASQRLGVSINGLDLAGAQHSLGKAQEEMKTLASKAKKVGVSVKNMTLAKAKQHVAASTKAYNAAVAKAKKYGVSISGKTLAQAQMTVSRAETKYNMAVTQAKKAGVSTKGSAAQIEARIDKAAKSAIAKNKVKGSASLTTQERAAIVASTGKSPVYVGPAITDPKTGKKSKPNYDFNPRDFTNDSSVGTPRGSNVVTNARTGEAITNSRTGEVITNSNTSSSSSSSSGGGGGGYSCYIATAMNANGYIEESSCKKIMRWCVRRYPSRKFETKLWRNGYMKWGGEIVAPRIPTSKALRWFAMGMHKYIVDKDRDFQAYAGIAFLMIPAYVIGTAKWLTGNLIDMRRT